MKTSFVKGSMVYILRTLAIAGIVSTAIACNVSEETQAVDESSPAPLEENSPLVESQSTDSPDVVITDVDSPVGGTVKQVTIPGPQSASLVVCNQEEFRPFAFSDDGLDWIGCELPSLDTTPGPAL